MANEKGMLPINEVNILKIAIANLVDNKFGSTAGWTNEREVKMLVKELQISPLLAKVILEACDEVREHNAYGAI